MAQRILTATVLRPDGEPWAGGVVDFTLLDDTYTLSPDASYPQRTVRAVTNADGEMTVTLAGGLDATWQVTMPDGETFFMLVGDGPTTTLETLRAAYTALVPEPPFDVQGFLASLVITDGAQPSDADLTAIADLAPSNDDFIQRKAGAWTNRTVAQVKSDILSAASDTAAGIVELATTAETTTGTDATRAVTPDGLHDMTSLAGAAWMLDEDTMSSNSDVKVPSQQSVKAYVDANGGGGVVLLFANTASSSAVASTASETAFSQSFTVPANSLLDGDVLHLRAWGSNNTHSSGTVTVCFRVFWGTVAGAIVVHNPPVATLATSSAYSWEIDTMLLFEDASATGTVRASGHTSIFTTAGVMVQDNYVRNTISGVVDTTASTALSVSVTHGASNAANTATLIGYVLQRLRT